MQRVGLCAVIAVVLAVIVPAFNAAGGVEVVSPDAQLIIADEVLPESIDRGEWSLLVWVYAPEAIVEPSSLLSIGGHLGVVAQPDGLVIEMHQVGHSATLRVDQPLRANRWHLLAVSMDFRSRQADAWLAAQSHDAEPGPIVRSSGRLQRVRDDFTRRVALRQSASTDIQPRRSGPLDPKLSVREPFDPRPGLSADEHGLVVGAWAAGLPAAELVYAALAIRNHTLADRDIDDVWTSRGFFDTHSLESSDASGKMNGWEGCGFLMFHSVSVLAVGSGSAVQKASYVGGPVTATNIMMVREPTERLGSRSGAFRALGPAVRAQGMVYSSHVLPELDGFFQTEPPPFDAPQEPIGPLGDKASMLVNGPQGLVRVIVSANSRGVRGTLFPQPWPEGFAHGFVQALYPQIAGVMMRPPTILDSRGGWFGIDTFADSPETSLVRALHTRTDSLGDWTRFGTGTLPAGSVGPGPASNISPTGVYRLRCRPMPGSLLVADAPLVYRSTVLAFPGSSDLIWEPERGLLQSGPGLLVDDPVTVPLDTTRETHTLTDDDAFLSDRELTLPASLDVREGEALVVFSGPARSAVSVAESVQLDGDRSTVTLSHPFGEQPGTGAELRVGPWRFQNVEYRFEPVPIGDDRTWRGLILRATSDDRLGVMVYGASAWRPDVDGFVFGAAGQSGKGYGVQLAETFPGSLEAWVAQAEVDVWIQALAQQRSSPSSMSDYLDRLRSGLSPESEVVWATSAVHASTTHETWHSYVEQNAVDEGVAAVFAVGHPRVGSYYAQAASGMRTDDAHFSSFGSRIIAEVWLEQLGQMVADPCDIADYDADGRVTVFDLLVFQSDWEAQDPRADLDGNGLFQVFDFLVLLNAMDSCD